MSLDADHIYAAVSKCGEEWADRKAAHKMLDDLTKTVLADLAGDIQIAYKCSRAEAKERAYSHERYKEHLSALATARREWLRAEVKWKSATMLSDLRRSEESTERAKMTLR